MCMYSMGESESRRSGVATEWPPPPPRLLLGRALGRGRRRKAMNLLYHNEIRDGCGSGDATARGVHSISPLRLEYPVVPNPVFTSSNGKTLGNLCFLHCFVSFFCSSLSLIFSLLLSPSHLLLRPASICVCLSSMNFLSACFLLLFI